ncbi:cytochrome c4 [Ramlibacter sp. USB13]|uniref:Cytochrome c4 n=1 Tax=Ramlibacter cellulosilyticus TaxID=2764187 RepID=A0A923MWW8_9BURK|nr:c-type cytochrome [Ramlibacter cellulosilyticus]MBC5785212.1 cytochrome c4 [Ramlibacter cellulosilyticus]
MNKLLNTLFALVVASVTSLALAQQPPATAPAGAPGANSPGATPAAGPASPKSLEAKVAMCVGCHGIVGYKSSFPEVYRVPKIAGQSAKYIAAALNAYKTGDRKHPTMRGIAESLSDQDVTDIAAYYEKLGAEDRKPIAEKPSREPSAQVAGLLQKAACASCHGANFSKPIDPSYPKIGGQYADYVFVALKAYKTENNPAVGRNNGVMGAIAKQFSNAELKALSNYVGSLEGEMATVPESRWHKSH